MARHAVQAPSGLRVYWGVCYAVVMGVCGLVLVALGASLSQLAIQCDTTSTKCGTVFLARGAGAVGSGVAGAAASAGLYAGARGNRVVVGVLLALAAVLAAMPLVPNALVLHVTFFILGTCTATLDTGAQIMTRKVHGEGAGPWLGANTVAFAVAGAAVPILQLLLRHRLLAQYGVVAAVCIATALALSAAPHPETRLRQLEEPLLREDGKATSVHAPAPSETKRWPYRRELLTGAAVFWLVGGKVMSTSYMDEYVARAGVIERFRRSRAPHALLALWIAITVGRLGGLWDQIHLMRAPTRAVFGHLCVWLLVGAAGAAALVLKPSSPPLFWGGVVAYGLGNGPCVGLCYDILNRLTQPSEEGMALVMLGLNGGASLVPYLTTLVWTRATPSPLVFSGTILLSMTAPALALAALFRTYRTPQRGPPPPPSERTIGLARASDDGALFV